MNWKLIFLLSLFGLAMGIATVFIIPSKIEPLFWLVIFLISAYIIAKRCSNKYFLHGLLVSIANSIWITACHVLLFDQYIANHAREAAMMTSRQMPMSPRVLMALTGPLIGVVSGLILGLFAVIASKIVRPSEPLR
jgi:uncharacterized membrane protein